ncbi:MAG TPA: V-type ATP synthase subunit E family protein [candidate division Zixibacteria bacterium]|nr:V-type ATP synthase subunit E family protein [candidate division Zixibacteria bacterium]
MSTEDVRINLMVEDIIGNAKIEANKFLTEAKEQIKEILEKGKTTAEKEKEEIIETEAKQIKELEKQQISSINLKARREILQKKEEEINQVFNLAKEELKKFPKKEAYKKVLQTMIIEAGMVIGGGNIVIKTRKEDKNILTDLTGIAKEITKVSGNKSNLKISKDSIQSIGGVIVQLEDESITIDNTFEARLEQKYRSIRTEVARKLFA